ncbi:hypothetical protein [Leptospira johnsonii]|uniref:Uncharacterized protein n=1 Tax=Leptospira johnsonii TaxID=1917820 RepID=A0A2P2D7P3_9LEPT|nr:hypothetical protein [Leptospira johnsonii]GBF40657.1 hypothetical protein LPTSP1_36750 [Leptospira johnsonii]
MKISRTLSLGYGPEIKISEIDENQFEIEILGPSESPGERLNRDELEDLAQGIIQFLGHDVYYRTELKQ